MGSPTHGENRRLFSPANALLAACACFLVFGCGPRADTTAVAPSPQAMPAAATAVAVPQVPQVPPRLQAALSITNPQTREMALGALFTEWIKSDIQGLNVTLDAWPRSDARWSIVLPVMTQILPTLNDRIGKEPALVHLVDIVSGAYAKQSPREAVNWAQGSLGRAARDVALSIMVEEVALVSPEQATKLVDDITDSVIRLDAIYGIAGSLGTAKRDGAFAWVATLPAANQPDATRAVLQGWAGVSPGETLTYVLREKIPGGMQVVFMRWAADAPGNAALAAKQLADPKARANAIEVVLDAFDQSMPVDGLASDWSRKLPAGAGRDAVNTLLAGGHAIRNPGDAWKITAAIDEAKVRDEARRSVITTVAADDPEIALKLINDGNLPAAEAAELRGLIAGSAAHP